MKWIDINIQAPAESENGTPVIVKLNTTKNRMYGNVVISIYYKGKFHKDFSKGFIQDVLLWMPLPK